MKNMKKVFIIALTACFLFFGAMGTISAKNVQEGKSSVVLTYNFNDYTALNVNKLTVSDSDGIVKSAKITSIKFSGKSGVQTEKYSSKAFMTSPNGPVDGTIKVTVTLKSSAKKGDSATVTLTGGYGDKNGTYHEKSWQQTVNVVAKASTPTTPTGKLDYTELKKQISIAEGLDANIYTSTSWAKLLEELSDGKAALKATTQKEIDKAARELADAIAQLVLMNWDDLHDAIAKANSLVDGQDAGDLWRRFLTALNNATTLITSTDQEAVDAAVAELIAAVEALQAYLGAQEGNVVVKPGDQFCNISLHNVWPILFFISLALNAVLAVLVGKGKKNKLNDNTPMVDYDISDDDK